MTKGFYNMTMLEHMLQPMKTCLETLKWEILLHPPYTPPDIASSDYHLFQSMGRGLAEQHFHSYEDAKTWVDF